VYLQDFAITFKWPSYGPEHFWSLAVEEHFYLFWPLLIFYFDRNKTIISIILLTIISFFVRFYLLSNHHEVHYFTFSRMDELAMGAFLAILEIENKLTSNSSQKFLLLLTVLLIPTVILWKVNNGSGNVTLQIFKYTLLSGIYLCFIGFTITSKDSNVIKKILKLKPFSFTGKISYGLYVYHPMCFGIYSYFLETKIFIIDLLGCFLTAYMVSAFSFYFFESKFLKLKSYFENKETELLVPLK